MIESLVTISANIPSINVIDNRGIDPILLYGIHIGENENKGDLLWE